MQALGRAHRIGQLRFQRVYIVTQDHSYDQLLQASQTKKMLQQIAGEGLIEIDVSDFEVTAEQIASVTADIDDPADQSKVIDALKDQALWRKGQAIARQSEAIIAQMMGQRCSRLSWADNKNLKEKDSAEQQMASPARVRRAPSSNVQPVPLSFGRSKEPSSGATARPALSANQEHQETAGPALPAKEPHQETAGPALPAKEPHKKKLGPKKKTQSKKKVNKKANTRSSARLAQAAEERVVVAAAAVEENSSSSLSDVDSDMLKE